MSQPPRPKLPPSGECKQDPSRTECPLTCKYNHFESEDLTINAWEIKCLDCGWRDTVGFRSDEEEEDVPEDLDPKQCPFCKLKDLPTGQKPCEQSS